MSVHTLEIDNGIIAVRLTKPIAGLKPAIIAPDRLGNGPFVPAPIQGIRHVDGMWTGTGPNPLMVKARDINWKEAVLNFPARSIQTRIIEKGPLRVVAEVAYTAYRPEYSYDRLYYQAGEGFYKSTITLDAGQNVFLVNDHSDMEVDYRFDLNKGVNANLGRYRGHGASDVIYGREPDGQVYRVGHLRDPTDAEVDISYKQAVEVGLNASPTTRPRLYNWYSWEANTGYYWQLFNSAAADGNLFGLFQGSPAQIEGCASACWVGIYNRTSASGAEEAGVSVSYHYRGPDARMSFIRKFNYGIFLGRKSTDLADPRTVQPIGKKMNLYSGISFNKTIKYTLDFPDPVEGWEGLYLTFDQMARKIRAIRSDKFGEHGNGIYGHLFQKDAYYRDVYKAFRHSKYANELTNTILATGRQALDTYVNTGDVYTHAWTYWQGGTRMQSVAIRANALLVLDRVYPFMTLEQRQKIKATLSLFGNIMWDNDFVPMDNFESFTLGTANMPVQQQGIRNLFSIMLKDHPSFSDRYNIALTNSKNVLNTAFNNSGASFSSPHYSGASIVPTTDVFRQLQVARFDDQYYFQRSAKESCRVYIANDHSS